MYVLHPYLNLVVYNLNKHIRGDRCSYREPGALAEGVVPALLFPLDHDVTAAIAVVWQDYESRKPLEVDIGLMR